MQEKEFAQAIRDGRTELRLSRARLSELIGRSVGSIRAWERGERIPRNPDTIITLAAALNLDQNRLLGLAGLASPTSRTIPTIEQELSTIAPSAVGPGTSSVQTEPTSLDSDTTVSTSTGEEAGSAVSAAGSAPDSPSDPPPVPSADAPPIEEPSPTEDTLDRQLGSIFQPRSQQPGTDTLELSWWDRFRQLISRRGNSASTGRDSAASRGVVPVPSYMTDPSQKMLYRLRNLYTTLGLFGLLLVLIWAVAQGLEAMGAILDNIREAIGI